MLKMLPTHDSSQVQSIATLRPLTNKRMSTVDVGSNDKRSIIYKLKSEKKHIQYPRYGLNRKGGRNALSQRFDDLQSVMRLQRLKKKDEDNNEERITIGPPFENEEAASQSQAQQPLYGVRTKILSSETRTRFTRGQIRLAWVTNRMALSRHRLAWAPNSITSLVFALTPP